VKRLQAANYILFSDMRNKVIMEMGLESLDEINPLPERIAASRVFLDHTKMPEHAADVQIDLTDEAKKALDTLFGGIALLAQNGKLVQKDGTIVDAEVIE